MFTGTQMIHLFLAIITAIIICTIVYLVPSIVPNQSPGSNESEFDPYQSAYVTNQPSNPELTEAQILRASEVFRDVDDKVFKFIQGQLEHSSFQKGDIITNIPEYGVCIVASGSVTVYIRDLFEKGLKPVEHDLDEKPTLTFLKHIQPGKSLIPLFVTVAALLGQELKTGQLASFSHILERLVFEVTEDTVLASLSRSALRYEAEQLPELSTSLFHSFIRRQYSACLPVLHHHLGLSHVVLELEKNIGLSRIGGLESPEVPRGELQNLLDSGALALFAAPDETAIIAGKPKQEDHSFVPMFGPIVEKLTTTKEPDYTDASQTESQNPKKALRLNIPSIMMIQKWREMALDQAPLSVLSEVEQTLLHRNRFQAMSPEYFSEAAKELFRRRVARVCFQTLGIGSVDSSETTKTSASILEDATHLFPNAVRILFFSPEAPLATAGQRYPGVYFIISGKVEIGDSQNSTDSDKKRMSFSKENSLIVGTGHVLGLGSLLLNTRSLFNIRAKTAINVAFISREDIHKLSLKYPKIVSTLAKRMLDGAPTLMRKLEFALDWDEISAGRTIYDQGDDSHSFHVLLSGRLRAIKKNSTIDSQSSREIGKDEYVGVAESYLMQPRPLTLTSIRKSSLLEIHMASLKAMAVEETDLGFKLAEIIAISNQKEASSASAERDQSDTTIQTITIVSVSPGIAIQEFVRNLGTAIDDLRLAGDDRTAVVTSSSVLNSVGGYKKGKFTRSTLDGYLELVEHYCRIVLYVVNYDDESAWAKSCAAHSDLILFVGRANASPVPTEREKQVAKLGSFVQSKLILVYEDKRVCAVGAASSWLKARNWISSYNHILMPHLSDEEQNEEMTRKEFQRLARRLLGRSIALVLGGGGARGLAHLGVIKVLEELGIPIDLIGGTSIGAFIGGVYARELTFNQTYKVLEAWSKTMRAWKFYLDLTLPYTSLTTGKAFNKLIKRVFGDLELTDFWLEYFCAVTNLSKNNAAEYYSDGEAWKMIRASMSITGLVPPICRNGSLLVDGCYANSLPVSQAKHLKADVVFAVDVSNRWVPSSQDYGNTWSGWLGLIFPNSIIPPSYSATTERLAFSTSLSEIEATKSTPGCHYTKQPVADFRATEFDSFAKLYEIGYEHAKQWLYKLESEGAFQNLAIDRMTREKHEERERKIWFSTISLATAATDSTN